MFHRKLDSQPFRLRGAPKRRSGATAATAGLTNQMRRAAVSISSNLAEGSSRASRPDFVRFVEIATGSLFEVVSQATISKRQGFLSETDFNRLYGACEKQSKMLSGPRRSLLENPA
jgi:four helix bundle protein